jgi:hypothetical protein
MPCPRCGRIRVEMHGGTPRCAVCGLEGPDFNQPLATIDDLGGGVPQGTPKIASLYGAANAKSSITVLERAIRITWEAFL